MLMALLWLIWFQPRLKYHVQFYLQFGSIWARPFQPTHFSCAAETGWSVCSSPSPGKELNCALRSGRKWGNFLGIFFSLFRYFGCFLKGVPLLPCNSQRPQGGSVDFLDWNISDIANVIRSLSLFALVGLKQTIEWILSPGPFLALIPSWVRLHFCLRNVIQLGKLLVGLWCRYSLSSLDKSLMLF